LTACIDEFSRWWLVKDLREKNVSNVLMKINNYNPRTHAREIKTLPMSMARGTNTNKHIQLHTLKKKTV